MKKLLLVIVLVVVLGQLAAGVALGQGNWIQGTLDPNGGTFEVWFHTSQQGNILHLRDICAADWSYCPRKTTVYDTTRFSQPPVCEFENGTQQLAFLWDDQIRVWDMAGVLHADYPSAWVCWDYSDPWPVP